MITRDMSQIYVVPALVHNARFHSCTVAGFTCYTDGATSAIGSSEFFPGFTIDRLGLPRNFTSVAILPVIYGDYTTTVGTGNICVSLLSAGIMHASASGGTFAAYSTGAWIDGKGLWRQSTATSTANVDFNPIQRDVGYTCNIGIGGVLASATSTASGQDMTAGTSSTSFIYYAGAPPVFSLTGAKQFIKCVMRTRFETTGCGTGSYHMSAALGFGEPDEAQPPYAPNKRILVTSACAT